MTLTSGSRSWHLASVSPEAAMELNLNRISVTVMIVGSLLFLAGAFLPVSSRVFPEPSPEKRLESISHYSGQWLAAQVLFAAGTVGTVIGVALYAYNARPESYWSTPWASVALLTAGAIPWLWQLYARASDPVWFAEGSYPMWPYLFYFLLTEVGLAFFGAALLSAPLPIWVGWVVISSMVLLAILTLIFRDMVPLAFYVVTLFAGVTMLG
jgi:hypothetical protein